MGSVGVPKGGGGVSVGSGVAVGKWWSSSGEW